MLTGLAVGATLVACIVIVRLAGLMRERARRRRWAAYRLRLPGILMARWPRNRRLSYQPDTTP